MSDQMLPFADAIRDLRAEILTAAEAGQDEHFRFELGPIELEFQVVARREGGPEAKIKFGVLGVGIEAGGSGKVASESVQKVKLTLNPTLMAPDGKTKRVLVKKIPLARSNS